MATAHLSAASYFQTATPITLLYASSDRLTAPNRRLGPYNRVFARWPPHSCHSLLLLNVRRNTTRGIDLPSHSDGDGPTRLGNPTDPTRPSLHELRHEATLSNARLAQPQHQKQYGVQMNCLTTDRRGATLASLGQQGRLGSAAQVGLGP